MSTRSKKKSVTAETSAVTKRVENSWILVLKESLFENNNFKIIVLPHPAHGKPAKFCLDDANKKIFEVVIFNEPYRSWFIGETVKSDGSLFMLTPFNPLFLILPLLKEQCTKRAVPLEDLLAEKGYDKIIDYVSNLDNVGDLKGPADLKAYKYSESKTLNWLESRIRKLAKVLREKNIHVTSGAVSATFVASNVSNCAVDEEFYLKYAHGIMSEYLQDEFINSLEKRFNFKPDMIESVGKKRKSEANETMSKRFKTEPENESKENILDNLPQSSVEVMKQKTLTTKEKARQKAASGTKTISSFFVKKSL